jgi:sugar phosphate isomerase/epimerase
MHLEALANQLAGLHIHDVEFPGRDHRPPGTGMIDFPALAPFVKPEHIKVLELSPAVSAEEVTASTAYLKSIWGEE